MNKLPEQLTPSEQTTTLFAESLDSPALDSLRESDLLWLNKVSGEKSLTADDLLSLDLTIKMGSKNLHYDTSPHTVAQVLSARKKFYEDALGWNQADNPLHEAYTHANVGSGNNALPISTIIGTMRLYEESDIDIVSLLIKAPAALSYGPTRIFDRLKLLADRDLPARKVVIRYPRILSINQITLMERIDNLTSLGVSSKSITGSPALLGISARGISERMQNMRSLGLDADQIVKMFPMALGGSQATVRSKIYALERFGYITDQRPFPKTDTDAPFIRKFFTLPAESLFLYLVGLDDHDPNTLRFLPDRSVAYAKSCGLIDKDKRIARFKDVLPTLEDKVGYIAILYALNNGFRKSTDSHYTSGIDFHTNPILRL